MSNPAEPTTTTAAKPKRIHDASARIQARLIQAVAHNAILAIDESFKATSSAAMRVQLTRALRDAAATWDLGRDALRVLQGKGLPKSVEGGAVGRRKKKLAPTMMALDDGEEKPAAEKGTANDQASDPGTGGPKAAGE